jgi:aspartate-semialdehyde dehydrogenase
MDKFGIRNCMCVTLQSLSGAGYPGVSSIDITDNIIPYINGEEEKLQEEPKKILGHLKDNQFVHASFDISASCNRFVIHSIHLIIYE